MKKNRRLLPFRVGAPPPPPPPRPMALFCRHFLPKKTIFVKSLMTGQPPSPQGQKSYFFIFFFLPIANPQNTSQRIFSAKGIPPPPPQQKIFFAIKKLNGICFPHFSYSGTFNGKNTLSCNLRVPSGKPLFKMCCFHMAIARKGRGEGGCKGLPGWFGAFFPPAYSGLTEGGVQSTLSTLVSNQLTC